MQSMKDFLTYLENDSVVLQIYRESIFQDVKKLISD
jgi:hypothetical protein